MKKKKSRAYYYRGCRIGRNNVYRKPWWIEKNGKQLEAKGFISTGIIASKTLQELKNEIDKILEPPNSIKFIKSLSAGK